MSDRVPDFFEPIVGYRWWMMSPYDDVDSVDLSPLQSTRAVWEPFQALEAQCCCPEISGNPRCHECPSPRGIENVTMANEVAPRRYYPCGIYAWRSLAELVAAMPSYGAIEQRVGTVVVCGAVRLWGLVYPHEFGWRAAFAYPHAFYVLIDQTQRDIYDGYDGRELRYYPRPDHGRAEMVAKAYGVPYEFSKEVFSAYRSFQASSVRGTYDLPGPQSRGRTPCDCPQCRTRDRRREEDERRAAYERAREEALARLSTSIKPIYKPWNKRDWFI